MKTLVMSIIAAMALAPAAVRAADAPPQGPIHVVAYIDVLASAAPQATALLKQYRDATRREPGATAVELFRQDGRTGGFAVVESWRDNAAFEAHGKAASVAALVAGLTPIQLGPWDVRPHVDYAMGRSTQAGAGSITLLTHVDVPPPFVADYEAMVKPYIDGSRKETAVARFDIVRAFAPRTNHFTVVETWASDAALEAHQKAPHTRAYREALAPKLGALYDERLYRRVD